MSKETVGDKRGCACKRGCGQLNAAGDQEWSCMRACEFKCVCQSVSQLGCCCLTMAVLSADVLRWHVSFFLLGFFFFLLYYYLCRPSFLHLCSYWKTVYGDRNISFICGIIFFFFHIGCKMSAIQNCWGFQGTFKYQKRFQNENVSCMSARKQACATWSSPAVVQKSSHHISELKVLLLWTVQGCMSCQTYFLTQIGAGDSAGTWHDLEGCGLVGKL